MKTIQTIAVLMLAGTALTVGCASSRSTTNSEPAPEPVLLEYTVMHKADYNVDDSETVKVFLAVDNDAEYRTELARYSIEIPKSVDFSQQRVIVSAMGTQPAGGYSVNLVTAEVYEEKVIATIELRSPGAGCIHTQAITNPYEFALLNTTKPIEFVETQKIVECTPT